jgi:voltage-dependent anion channel protein 2
VLKYTIINTTIYFPQVFGGSVYQKVSPQLETGVNLGWTSTKNETSFGIGCKYELDKQASLRAKVNNSSQIGLGYQQKLRDGNFFFT